MCTAAEHRLPRWSRIPRVADGHGSPRRIRTHALPLSKSCHVGARPALLPVTGRRAGAGPHALLSAKDRRAVAGPAFLRFKSGRAGAGPHALPPAKGHSAGEGLCALLSARASSYGCKSMEDLDGSQFLVRSHPFLIRSQAVDHRAGKRRPIDHRAGSAIRTRTHVRGISII
jgi:hypothetical protein